MLLMIRYWPLQRSEARARTCESLVCITRMLALDQWLQEMFRVDRTSYSVRVKFFSETKPLHDLRGKQGRLRLTHHRRCKHTVKYKVHYNTRTLNS